MVDILWFILSTLILGVVTFGGFSLLSRYVFNRVRVNKWIILAIAIVAFVIPLILPMFISVNYFIQMIFIAIFVIALLWFLDVNKNGYPRYKKEKKVVIKSKAKPNRAKNNNNKK